MLVKQFVDENLGNSSYLVASEETGQAAVIDPQRDVERYVQIAEGLGLKLTHALETHLHADFVSGLRELAEQYQLVIGASAESHLAFGHLRLQEGDTIDLGDLSLGVVATPGHTPEHVSFTLRETDKHTPSAIFTGGALIVGGAARTDLMGHHLTKPLTHLLYHTIHDTLLQLPDDVIVYPTHGAGSFCNTPSSSERVTTIGNERKWNPLAKARSEQEFLKLALEGLPSYPTYFQYLRAVNQLRTRVLKGLPRLHALTPRQVQEQMEQGVLALDARSARQFAAAHIPKAYGIPLNTPLNTWAGWVIPFNAPLLLIEDDSSKREQAMRQLFRIGYDEIRGYLDGGMVAWQAEGFPVARVPVMSVGELYNTRANLPALAVLDVRQDAEWRAGHFEGAIHIEGGQLDKGELALAKEQAIVVHCGHSDRSTVAISLLERRGYQNVRLLYGGFSAWQKAGYPVVGSTKS